MMSAIQNMFRIIRQAELALRSHGNGHSNFKLAAAEIPFYFNYTILCQHIALGPSQLTDSYRRHYSWQQYDSWIFPES